MSLYVGPFYLRDSDLFLFVSVLFGFVLLIMPVNIPYFDAKVYLLLVALLTVARGFIPSTHSSIVYLIFLAALGVSFFSTLPVVFLFVSISFLLTYLFKFL